MSVSSTSGSALPPIPGWDRLVKSDFWFRDGNIVLLAGAAAFRVHRGQLERHSDVFKDLFCLPQPPEQEEETMIEGCAWVELHDSPADVCHFLGALYDGLYFKPTSHPSDFPILSAVLRLSTKYLVEPLRARCLARLERDWPATLAGWDARERAALDRVSGRYLPREVCAHPVLVIELAVEMGVTRVLPAAFYDLARYGPSKIMGGTTRGVGALDVVAGRESGGKGRGRSVVLSREMLVRTFRGREASQRCVSEFVERELEGRRAARGCENCAPGRGELVDKEVSAQQRGGRGQANNVCLESFYFIMLNILRSVGGIACGRDADPLFTLVQATEMLTRTDFSDGERQMGLRICAACKEEFRGSVERAREEVWRGLPGWFGLEGEVGWGEERGEGVVAV